MLDNPSLTTRQWYGKNPIRLVIDKDLTLPTHLHLFDGEVRTIVFTHKANIPSGSNEIEFIALDFNHNILPQLMEVLYKLKIQSLMVEGGSILLQSFIDADCWDEACIETSPLVLKAGVKAPDMPKKYDYLTETRFGRELKYVFNKSSNNEK